VVLVVGIDRLLVPTFAVGAVRVATLGTERDPVAGPIDGSEGGTGAASDGYRSALIRAHDDSAGAATSHVANHTVAADHGRVRTTGEASGSTRSFVRPDRPLAEAGVPSVNGTGIRCRSGRGLRSKRPGELHCEFVSL
jgi:hypothetical protein